MATPPSPYSCRRALTVSTAAASVSTEISSHFISSVGSMWKAEGSKRLLCIPPSVLNAEGIFHFVEEAALVGLDLVLFELGELLEQVALTGRELRGGAHTHRHVLVATAHAAQVRDAFLAQTEGLARLRARGNGEHLAPVDGRHLRLVAESSLREGDRQLIEDVAPFALEEGVGLDLEHDVEVTGGTAPGAGLAFAGEADLPPPVHPPRDLYREVG